MGYGLPVRRVTGNSPFKPRDPVAQYRSVLVEVVKAAIGIGKMDEQESRSGGSNEDSPGVCSEGLVSMI